MSYISIVHRSVSRASFGMSSTVFNLSCSCHLQTSAPDWAPLLVFGCLSLAAGLLALLLPDALQKPLPPTSPRHIEPRSGPGSVGRLVVTSSEMLSSAERTNGSASPNRDERRVMRQVSPELRETETVRQVRELQTYSAVLPARRRSEPQRRPRPGIAASSLCSCTCSCYSPGRDAVPALLTGDNVTMIPRFDSTGKSLYSYGQSCPYCVNSMRRRAAVFRGELSGATAASNIQSRGNESGEKSSVSSYDVPPRTRRVPWWRRGTDATTRAVIERCVVDGRIVTTTRGELDDGPVMLPQPAAGDTGVRAESRSKVRPNRPIAGSPEVDVPSRVPVRGAQNVRTRGMISGPAEGQLSIIRETDLMSGPIHDSNAARRVVSETPVGGGGGRKGDGVGDRNGGVAVHRLGDRSGGDIVRLVIARVGS